MGYLTVYELKIKNAPLNNDVINHLREINENAEYSLTEFGDCDNSSKWYDHEHDLLEFSKLYPHLIFELYGDGECDSDLWIKYFKDGKMQLCEAIITFDEYDENKLT